MATVLPTVGRWAPTKNTGLGPLPYRRQFRGHKHPGGNPRANIKSISQRCYLREVAFEWELTKETIYLPLGCLHGGYPIFSSLPRWRDTPCCHPKALRPLIPELVSAQSNINMVDIQPKLRTRNMESARSSTGFVGGAEPSLMFDCLAEISRGLGGRRTSVEEDGWRRGGAERGTMEEGG